MRGQVVGQTFDLKVGHDGAGIFNAAIISRPPPLSPAGCGEIRSQPASDQGGGDSDHGFRNASTINVKRLNLKDNIDY